MESTTSEEGNSRKDGAVGETRPSPLRKDGAVGETRPPPLRKSILANTRTLVKKHREMSKSREEESKVADAKSTTYDCMKAYQIWEYETYVNSQTKIPTDAQKEVLNAVHDRRVAEHMLENGVEGPSVEASQQPLLRLIHGLPGSGKTELLHWIRSYFEQVWHSTLGVEFMFIAPMNTMASSIGGATVHSYGHVPFKDRRGFNVSGRKSADSEEVPSMTIKFNALRFLFIDEIEATGADVIGKLEHNIRFHIHTSNRYRYQEGGKEVRPFGGVNVCFFGDFWQLNPTGQIAIMSNPYSEKALSNATASAILNMFWNADNKMGLQCWRGKERVLHLSTNLRSGVDKWFSDVLDACRLGCLPEDDYNFLHGLPTQTPVTFWFHQREAPAEWHQEQHPTCHKNQNKTSFEWHHGMAAAPRDAHSELECRHCFQVRQRRCRVLNLITDPAGASEKLRNPTFGDSVLITPYNQAVTCYGTQRARNFAASTQHQLFWMQAVDTPPAWFCNNYTKADLLTMKKKWLAYNARKTEGILSLLPG